MTFTCSYFHTFNCADCMNHTFALNKFDAASTATECNQLVKAYIKGIPNVFRAGLRDPCTRDVARLSESVKNTRAAGECIFTFSESRATSQVHGSRYLAWKTIW